MAATPASSKRRAMSNTVTSDVSAQPSTATLPSRASSPTATRAGAARRRLHQFGVAYRRGADDDAVHALAEPAFDARHATDAAAELHRDIGRLEDALDRSGVHRLAGKGAVEVDDVEILEAGHLEGVRLRRGVVVEHRRARHVALLEPDRASVLEVDRGEQDLIRHSGSRANGSGQRPAEARLSGSSSVSCSSGFRARASRARNDPKITASTSGNWQSAAAPAAGSSRGEIACPPCCRGRRWP